MKTALDTPASRELTVTGTVFDLQSKDAISGIKIEMASFARKDKGRTNPLMSVESESGPDGYFSVTMPTRNNTDFYAIIAIDVDGEENGEYKTGGIDAIEWDGRMNLIPGQDIFLQPSHATL
ncbi:MAG: hypothetical protein MJY67_04700 [Bacteroidales bacterium]|nr:hypothetical protein [Bacteroidales bacterium]